MTAALDPVAVLGNAEATVVIRRHASGTCSLHAESADRINITLLGRPLGDLLQWARDWLELGRAGPDNVVALRSDRGAGGCGGLPADSEPAA